MKQIVREAVWVCSCYKVCLWGVTVTNFTERVLARIEFPISVLPFVVATLGAIIWNSLTVHDFFARVLLKVKKGALLACFISIILLLLVIGRQNWTTQASTMDLLWCKRSLQGYPFGGRPSLPLPIRSRHSRTFRLHRPANSQRSPSYTGCSLPL